MTIPDSTVPGGFWRRATAQLIDCVVIFFVSILLSVVLSSVMSQAGLQIGLLLLASAYYVFCLAGPWQATIGKRLMGVFVVAAEDGSRIAVSRALFRYFMYSGIFLLCWLYSAYLIPKPGEALRTPEMQRYFLLAQTPEAQRNYEQQREMLSLRERNQSALETYETEVRAAISSPMFVISQLAMGIYAVGLLVSVAVSHRKIGWHDRICKTRVIRGRPEAPEQLQLRA